MPRTEEQLKKIRESAKQKIIEASLKLFAGKGFKGTSMSDIAGEAGISKGLAYNYFSSKDDIVKSIIDMAVVEAEEYFGPVFMIKDPFEKINEMIELSFKYFVEKEEAWRFYLSIMLQPDVLKMTGSIIGNFAEELYLLIEEIFHEINIKDAASEAKIFGALMDGIAFHYMLQKENYPIDVVKKKVLQKYSKSELSRLI